MPRKRKSTNPTPKEPAFHSDKPLPPEHPLVAKIVKDPAKPPRTHLIRGFVGRSDQKNYTRVYFNSVFSEYVDIPNEGIVHFEEPDRSAFPLSPTLLWVSRDAAVINGRLGAPPFTSTLLAGRIYRQWAKSRPEMMGSLLSPIVCTVLCTPVIPCLAPPKSPVPPCAYPPQSPYEGCTTMPPCLLPPPCDGPESWPPPLSPEPPCGPIPPAESNYQPCTGDACPPPGSGLCSPFQYPCSPAGQCGGGQEPKSQQLGCSIIAPCTPPQTPACTPFPCIQPPKPRPMQPDPFGPMPPVSGHAHGICSAFDAVCDSGSITC